MLGAYAAISEALLQVEGRLLRWESATAVESTLITYAVLTGPFSVPGSKSILSPSNCSAMHAFRSILDNSPGLSEEMARRELRKAFASWEAAANITFAEVSDPSVANIVIGAQDIPNGKAFANLSYRADPLTTSVAKALGNDSPNASVSPDGATENQGVTGIDQAYVCLNPALRWKVGFDGELDIYDLRYTFTHEIGHAIGLDHPDDVGSPAVMSFRYDERVQNLQPSDIAAVRRLYGPPKVKK